MDTALKSVIMTKNGTIFDPILATFGPFCRILLTSSDMDILATGRATEIYNILLEREFSS